MDVQPQLLIVTGFSGAGKSSVLKALEDVGFFCIDNLPYGMVTHFFQFFSQLCKDGKPVALGLDVRGGSDIKPLVKELSLIKSNPTLNLKILFLTSTTNVILKRFQETRRKHPLAEDIDLLDAIEKEKSFLKSISEISDITIDTDQLNIHELRALVKNIFTKNSTNSKMIITVMSFGFKYGAPTESNFVFDVRFLPNPYFIPELKPFPGTDTRVRDYILHHEQVKEYWPRLIDFLTYSIEKSYSEGRFFMNIAIGCTGGKHRSVAIAQELVKLPINYVQFFVKHRDIQKE